MYLHNYVNHPFRSQGNVSQVQTYIFSLRRARFFLKEKYEKMIEKNKFYHTDTFCLNDSTVVMGTVSCSSGASGGLDILGFPLPGLNTVLLHGERSVHLKNGLTTC